VTQPAPGCGGGETTRVPAQGAGSDRSNGPPLGSSQQLVGATLLLLRHFSREHELTFRGTSSCPDRPSLTPRGIDALFI